MAKGQKVNFDVTASDKTKAGLASAQRNLKKTGKEADKLAGRFRNVARATVIMEGPLGGTAGRLSAMATMLNNVGLGTIAFGVGLTGLTAIVVKSMARFSEFEKQQFKIEQLLKSTSGAVGLTTNELSEMAERIGLATLESIEGVREAQGVLLTFKGIGSETFGAVMDAAADMSAINPSQGLVQSVLQLGKALEDPLANMGALRRSGVSFTNMQKDTIVAMKQSGDAAGAQAAMLKLLKEQMGGVGESAAGGLAGATDTLSERWGLMLEKFAKSGAGSVATRMVNALAGAVENFNTILDPENAKGLADVNADIVVNQKELNSLKETSHWWDKGRIGLLEREYVRLLDKREVIHDALFWEKESVRVAREKGELAQKDIAATQAAGRAAEKAAAAEKVAIAERKKQAAGASSYGQKLIDEEAKLQTSLLNKGQQEDIFLEQRMAKIDENLAAKLISEEQAHAQEQAAFSIHNTKMTEIARDEKEKQAEDEDKLQKMQVAATESALTDIGTLMAASSKRLFKLGQGAAIANSLINTYQAVTKTMASVPYPFNIPLAIAQGVAGMVQVQKIKQQKMSAKEHGGSVIGGRSYLVGERGPELFTPPRTGQIINNSTTNATGGQSNNINVTVVNDVGEEFVERNAVKIWNSIVDKMNEEGLRFA